MLRQTITITSGLLLTACATGPYEWKYGQDKIVPGQFAIVGNQGSVLTWPAHAVGAVVYPGTTGACIQSAQSAKARGRSGSGGLTIKVPEGPEASGNLAQAINEVVSGLQDKNDVATFADVALFQICTIAANNKLTTDQTMVLVQAVMQASVDIAKARPTTTRTVTTVSAPQSTLAKAPDLQTTAQSTKTESK